MYFLYGLHSPGVIISAFFADVDLTLRNVCKKSGNLKVDKKNGIQL